MKKYFTSTLTATIISVVLFSANAKAQIDPGLAAQLQQILDNRVQFNGNHGVSACVIMPDGEVWKGTAGVGAGGLAITDSTVFHGASTMKSNIATLLLLLAEEGIVNLDSSWHHYVSLNVNFDTTITIRQLLGHTSGIADFLEVPGSGNYVTTDFNHAYTPVDILENIVSGVPDFPAGTNFTYSTSNYVLAALIAETVTGNPVQQELRNRIWAPLGMTHTYFGGFEPYTEPRSGVWWDFGSGMQDYSDSAETSMLTYGYGGANMLSTAEDLAHYARALFTDTLLSAASLSEMKTFSPDSYASWCEGYGLGIHHADMFTADSVLGHDGYYTNMSDMFHSHEYGFTLVTMTNTATQWFAIFNQMYSAIRTQLTTGTEEEAASSMIQVFPNPANDHFSLSASGVHERASVRITDVTGKTVYSADNAEVNGMQVNTQSFEDGVYFVQIQTETYQLGTKLFIIH